MNRRFWITFFLCSLVIGQIMAMPARKEYKKYMQPDGTYVTAMLCGDERLSWFESPDGDKLLRDDAGFLTYAVHDAKGDLVPSHTVYRQDGPTVSFTRGVVPGGRDLTFSEGQRRAAMSRAPQAGSFNQIFPTEGKCNLLMLLVNFADTEPTRTSEEISRMMNEEGYNGIGSFKDFITANSCGKLDIDVTVTDWLTLDQEHDYFYYGNSGDNSEVLIYMALLKADPEIDFSKYDNDGDGVVDGIMVLHQGFGQESSGNANDIWSHTSNLTYYYSESMLTFDGVLLDAYTVEPELIHVDATTTVNSTIGVFCHEFMHNLGAMDFYDADYEANGGDFQGTARWDVLADGSWNGNNGDRPAMANPFQRIAFGWLPESILLEEDTEVTELASVVESQTTYRMNTDNPGDYFIIENRQQSSSPFDAGLPGSGVLIYHVNEEFYDIYFNRNMINATARQSVYVVDASAGRNPGETPATFGSATLQSAPYGGAYKGFNPYTLPSPIDWNGTDNGMGLYNIANYSNGLVSFEYAVGRELRINSASARSADGNIYLSWDGPEVDGATVRGYNFYMNMYGTLTNRGLQKSTSLTLKAIPQGLNEYAVSIVFGNNEETELTHFSIYIPQECLVALEAVSRDGKVLVTWTEDEQIKAASQSPFVEYRVYRNGEMIGTTTATSFEDTAPTGGNDTYAVKSYWEGDVELPGLTVQLANSISSAAADSFGLSRVTYDSPSRSVVCEFDSDYDNAGAVVEVYALDGQCLARHATTAHEGSNTVAVRLNDAATGIVLVKVTLQSRQGASEAVRKVVVY